MRKDKFGFFRSPWRAGSAFRQPALAVAILGLLSVLAGCNTGGKDKLIPVTGKVTLDGAPLTAGQVAFHPELDKDSKATGVPSGSIGADGTYTLTTNGKPGAPAGKYKATVVTNFPGVTGTPVPINAKYNAPGTSGLPCEVTPSAAAGAYDLKLTK